MNKSIKNIMTVVLGMGLLFALAACDKNYSSPDDLQANQMGITEFTASTDQPVALKQSITFKFNVSDPENEFDKLEIVDTLGNTKEVKATSGTVSIVPPATTEYQLNVYAKEETVARVNSEPIRIEVYDPSDPNTLIIEPSVDENTTNKNCSDNIDNDYDGSMDCDDVDCASDETCANKYEITYMLESEDGSCHSCEGIENCSCSWSSSNVDIDPPVYNQGQKVTISWNASSCSSVTLLDESGAYHLYQPAEGSRTVTLDVAKSITLYGLDAAEVKQSSVTVELKPDIPVAEAPKTYDGNFSTTVSTSSVIRGQSITYSWNISSEFNSATLSYLGEDKPIAQAIGSETITSVEYGDASQVHFTFKLTDYQGIEGPADTKSVSIYSYKSCSDCADFGNVKQVVEGLDGYDYVLTTDNKIYQTKNGGKSFGNPVITYSETVSVFSVDTASNIYVSTATGIFKGNTQIASCCGSTQTVQSIYAYDANFVLVGTDQYLYTMKPKNGSCDAHWFDDGAYCVYYASIAGRSGASGWVSNGGNPLSIIGLIPDHATRSKTVIAATAGGAYVSTNSGNSFGSEISNDPYPTAGYLGNTASLLWTETAVYPFSSNTAESAWDLPSDMESDEHVNFAGVVGDLKILATSQDLYYAFVSTGSSWVECGLGRSVEGVVGMESGDPMNVRIVLGGGEVYQLATVFELLENPVAAQALSSSFSPVRP